MLLEALSRKKRIVAHSDAFKQYRLLIERGIVQVLRVGSSDRFETILIETEENLRALDTAISWIAQGRPFDVADVNANIKQFIEKSTYEEPIVARAKKEYLPSKASQRITQQLIEEILTS